MIDRDDTGRMLVACALAGQDGQWRHLSGNGLRDTCRIAGSDPSMWIEIFQQNRAAVLVALTVAPLLAPSASFATSSTDAAACPRISINTADIFAVVSSANVA